MTQKSSCPTGAFVVMKVQITDIDILPLVRKAKGPEFGATFESVLAGLIWVIGLIP